MKERNIKATDDLKIVAVCSRGWAIGETLAQALEILCDNSYNKKNDFIKDLFANRISVFVTNAESVDIYPSCVLIKGDGALVPLSKTNAQRKQDF